VVGTVEAVRQPSDLLDADGPGEECAPWETPVGTFLVSWGGAGLTGLAPVDLLVERLRGRRPCRVDTLPDNLHDALDRRLRGERAELDIDLRGLTDFERAVLAKTGEIPHGEIRPYGWIAREIGRPAAVRAVGSALGRNPVPLAIPCHRVVRTDGTVGHYAFGQPMKLQLLALEGLDPAAVEGAVLAHRR
jgi:O-6-methylguanine DNA methyltransferase